MPRKFQHARTGGASAICAGRPSTPCQHRHARHTDHGIAGIGPAKSRSVELSLIGLVLVNAAHGKRLAGLSSNRRSGGPPYRLMSTIIGVYCWLGVVAFRAFAEAPAASSWLAMHR